MTQIWIDVEDLFEYARSETRPSGIQRLSFEIGHALLAHDSCAGTVHFIRHAPTSNSFRVVPWSEVATLFANLTDGRVTGKVIPDAVPPHGSARQLVRKLMYRLPLTLRGPATNVLLTTALAARAWVRLLSTVVYGTRQALWKLLQRRRTPGGIGMPSDQTNCKPAMLPTAFDTAAAPGDILLVLGSPWSHPDYAALIRIQREKRKLRFALLVYDLIPLRRPEWCEAGLVRLFRAWFSAVLPLCDHVFAISRATAADVETYAVEHGITLPQRVVPIPIGTKLSSGMLFDRDADASPGMSALPVSNRRLPSGGTYALIVATIEARKNHLLLFRVWRRLLEDLPAEQVPVLVFAGRIGWLVDDLMRQITNTASLDGKLILVESPTDAELAALYRGCLFTLFPSFYEGWGLPVTESLAFGKPCLISDRTSLPEAGGRLARSFDPDNLHDAYAVIREVIEDRVGLLCWEAKVKREFKPTPWSVTADALLAGLALKSAPASLENK